MKDILKIPSNKQVWFTSDTHFGHTNICLGTSTWENKESKCRNFNSLEEMNNHIVANINDCVGENDILIHLGDWSFGGIENVWNFRKQIKCKNIYLVLGNHDHHIRNNSILPNVKRVEPYSSVLVDGKPGCYIGDDEYPDYVEAQSLFTEVEHYLEIQIDKTLLCCMHFPIEEWNNRGNSKLKYSYMVHGHQHGDNRIILDRIDIGLDSIFKLLGRMRPIRSDELVQLIKQQNKEYDCNLE